MATILWGRLATCPTVLLIPMALYDIFMLIVLVATTLWGVWKGMAWQVAALASVVVSAAVAVHSSPAVAPGSTAQEPWNRYVAMLLLYVVTAAAIWIVFHLVSNVIDRVQLKEFDRQLGAIFGLAKGILYCVVITFFAVTLYEPTRQLVLQSRIRRPDRPRHSQRKSDFAGRRPHVFGQVHRRVRREAACPTAAGAAAAGPAAVAAAKRSRSPCPQQQQGGGRKIAEAGESSANEETLMGDGSR